jgi:hypothetical protein
MYCSSCGTAMTQGLNYCNRCGANLVPVSNAPVSKLVALVWSIPLAMALITLGGLGMLFYIGLELTRRGADASPTGALLMLVDLLAVLIIDWMLIRQLSRVIDIYRPPGEVTQGTQPDLIGKQQAQIEAQHEPATFVTEHTTRIFEPSGKKVNRR